MNPPDGESESDPAAQTRVSDRPPAEARVPDTRVSPPAPPVAPSPPGTADPIVLDPAPAIDTSHAEPSATALLPADRPEILVGAAFAGGLIAAMILRHLGR